MSSNLEMKMNDALFGLAPNFALPCTKKFDGKKLTFEFAKAGFLLALALRKYILYVTYTERSQYLNETHLKSFNDLKLAVDTTFTPSSGALGNVVKADYNANGITAGVKFRIQKSRLASLVKAS